MPSPRHILAVSIHPGAGVKKAPPAGAEGALMYFLRKEVYFLRRRAARVASASRESVPEVGSGTFIR